MSNTQFSSRLADAVVVAAQDDVDVGPQLFPTSDRIALNNPGMTDEALRDGEEREERAALNGGHLTFCFE